MPGGQPEGTGLASNNHHSNNKGPGAGAGLHQVHADEWLDDDDLLGDHLSQQQSQPQGGGGRGGGRGGGGGVTEMVDLLDLNDDDDNTNNNNNNNHRNNNNNNLLLPLPPVPTSAPSSSSSNQGLSNDPFSSSDPFSLAPLAPTPASASGLPVALALSPSQLAQHKAWGQAAVLNGGGPLYDDGTLQV